MHPARTLNASAAAKAPGNESTLCASLELSTQIRNYGDVLRCSNLPV